MQKILRRECGEWKQYILLNGAILRMEEYVPVEVPVQNQDLWPRIALAELKRYLAARTELQKAGAARSAEG